METSFMWLCEVSLAMFLGSMMAGLIPLRLSISEKKMRLCQIFGAGLLIGTAFTVIIPEGIETLYSARPHEKTVRTERAVNVTREKRHAHHHAHDECEEYRTPHIGAKLGFSLMFGFMLMLLIDQLSATPRSGRAMRRQMGTSATIGLAVHAAVDGVAMGTSSFSDQESLKWIIFMAIMLHKMPAAFGLVSFLRSTRISARRIFRYLTVFSLSAPSAALVTFWLMNWITWLSSQVATGCLMLFSAGTFMYVATIHVFPELNRSSHNPPEDDVVSSELEAMVVDMQKPLSAGSHHHHGHSHSVGPSLSRQDLFFMMLGSLLPDGDAPVGSAVLEVGQDNLLRYLSTLVFNSDKFTFEIKNREKLLLLQAVNSKIKMILSHRVGDIELSLMRLESIRNLLEHDSLSLIPTMDDALMRSLPGLCFINESKKKDNNVKQTETIRRGADLPADTPQKPRNDPEIADDGFWKRDKGKTARSVQCSKYRSLSLQIPVQPSPTSLSIAKSMAREDALTQERIRQLLQTEEKDLHLITSNIDHTELVIQELRKFPSLVDLVRDFEESRDRWVYLAKIRSANIERLHHGDEAIYPSPPYPTLSARAETLFSKVETESEAGIVEKSAMTFTAVKKALLQLSKEFMSPMPSDMKINCELKKEIQHQNDSFDLSLAIRSTAYNCGIAIFHVPSPASPAPEPTENYENRAQDGGEECPICFDLLDDKKSLLKCVHCIARFHCHCIDTWHKINKICPVCRGYFPSDADYSALQ